jgi:two-component system copper resistance phosphate regulon response regulator CusR
MRILVIEDDAGIGGMIRRGLSHAGYEVDLASNGTKGLELAERGGYGLILLDLMLPGMDGWQLCKLLRARREQVPIMMLTALDGVDDLVRGLDTGADDYLSKPFDFNELLARVRALLRREKVHRVRVIRVADLEIDTAQRRVARRGREVELSHREYELLEALAASEGRVLSREAIQARVWMNEQSSSNTVDVYVGLLRKKIDAGESVKLIHTVNRVGYTLRAPEKDAE